MTKFYVDAAGKYLGGFEGPRTKKGAEKKHPDVPPGAVEIPTAPRDARQTWDGIKWSVVPPAAAAPLDAEELYKMLETKGVVTVADRPRPKPTRI